ncbi:MAG: metallophosphoesterase [Prochlorococcaceae cyanobacterium]
MAVGMPLNRRRLLALGLSGLGAAGWQAWTASRAGSQAPLPSRLPSRLPLRGDQRLVLISDLNSSYGSTTYIPEVQKGIAMIPGLKPDLVLCAGDMVAGQKAGLSAAQLAAMWAGFDRQVLQPLRSAGVPFAPAMGNHDASSLRQGGRYLFEADRHQAARFWRSRQAQLGLQFEDASGFPFFYSFRHQDLFVLVWDASSATVPAEQLRWAERSLASAAARSARRRLVLGHLPLQAVAQGRDTSGDVLAAASELRLLLERHGVQAYVSGHQHAYFPSRLGRLDLVQLGALGSGPRRLLGRSEAPFQTLTLLDLPSADGPSRETTINLRSVQLLDRSSLPSRLLDGAGRQLIRRDS